VRLGENPCALLECLHLEELWCSCFTAGFACYSWWLPPPRRLGVARIIERRKVLVSSSNHSDCEGFLTFPQAESQMVLYWIACGLCDPHLVLVVRHPIEDLGCDAN
jgi:hypothetical protein